MVRHKYYVWHKRRIFGTRRSAPRNRTVFQNINENLKTTWNSEIDSERY